MFLTGFVVSSDIQNLMFHDDVPSLVQDFHAENIVGNTGQYHTSSSVQFQDAAAMCVTSRKKKSEQRHMLHVPM